MAQKTFPKYRTEAENQFWRRVWQSAVLQMPEMRKVKFVALQISANQRLPLRLYMELKANRNLTVEGKHRLRRTVLAYEHSSGQLNLLLSLLGDLDPHARYRWAAGIRWGFQPQNPARRARLLSLARDGNKIAWDFLKLVGKDHLYSDKPRTGELYCILNPKHLKKYKEK